VKNKYRRLLIILLLTFFWVGAGPIGSMQAHAVNLIDLFPEFTEYQDQFADFFVDVDEEQLPEVFDFLQEKVADGSLKSESGIEKFIKEGKEKFGNDIGGGLSELHLQNMVELANALEDMGFNTERIVEQAREMYEEKGMDFVNYIEEIVTDAIKESVGTMIKLAISRFFQTIIDFFKNLLNIFQ